MKILFYRYNSICEPDVIEAFKKLGLTVIEETTQMRVKDTTPMQTVETVSRLMDKERFLFVFSINFFPALSEVCRIYDIPYVCWSVDVPVMELFSPAFSNKCNRVFLFDRSQYEYFRDKNPGNVFHLPLATNTSRWERVISSAGSALHKKFASDISFIGSLYNEKNPFPEIKGLSEYTRGYLEGIIEAQSQLWGVNFLESMLTDEVMAELDPLVSELHGTYCRDNDDARRYLIAHTYLGSQLAVNERLKYLGALSEHFDLDLYTLSDASQLQNAHVHPNGANTLTEMPHCYVHIYTAVMEDDRPLGEGIGTIRVHMGVLKLRSIA